MVQVPGPECLVSGMTGWPGWPEGEVCWNFYSLLGALSAFSCTWMNDRARRNYIDTEKCMKREEGIIKYLFYLSGFYVKSPPFQLLFTELHQLNLILEICFMIFSDLICCEFVQVLFDHKRGRVSETFTSIPLNISR